MLITKNLGSWAVDLTGLRFEQNVALEDWSGLDRVADQVSEFPTKEPRKTKHRFDS